MENWDYGIQATNVSLTSQGSAMKEQAVYMGSYEAKLNSLKAQFSEMALTVGDDFLNDAILNTMEFGRIVVETISLVSKQIGLLPTLGAGVGIFAEINSRKKNKGRGILSVLGGFDAENDGWTKNINLFKTSMKEASQYSTLFRENLMKNNPVMQSSAGMFGKIKDSINNMRLGMVTFGQTAPVALASVAKGFIGLAGAVATAMAPMLAFAGITWVIEKVSETVRKHREAEEALAKQVQDSETIMNKYGTTVSGMVSEYEALRSEYAQLGENMDEDKLRRYYELSNDLSVLMPSMVEYVDEQGNAHLKASDALKTQAGNLEQIIKLQKEADYKGLTSDIESQAKGVKDLANKMSDLKREMDLAKDYQKGGFLNKTKGFLGQIIGDGVDIRDSNATQKLEIQRVQLLTEYSLAWDKTADSIANATGYQLEHIDGLGALSNGAQQFISNYAKNIEKIDFNALLDMKPKKQEDYWNDYSQKVQQKTHEVGLIVGRMYKDIRDNVPEDMFKGISQSMDKIITDNNEKLMKLPTEGFENWSKGVSEAMITAVNTGNFSRLRTELDNLGYSSRESNKFIKDLGEATDSSAIKAKYLAGELGATDEELENINNQIKETINLTEVKSNPLAELYGFDEGQMDNLYSHLETLKLLQKQYGEGWKDSDKATEIFTNLSNTTKLSFNSVKQNYDEISNLMRLYADTTIETNEKTGEQIVKIAGKHTDAEKKMMNDILDDMLKNNKQWEDILRERYHVVEDVSKATLDKFNLIYEASAKQGFSGDNTVEFASIIKQAFSEINGSVDITMDKLGNYKLALSDGSTSPFLDQINNMLTNNEENFELVKTASGQYELQLKGVGKEGATSLAGISDAIDGTNDKLSSLQFALDTFLKSKNDSDKNNVFGIISNQVNELKDKIKTLNITKDGFLDTSGLSGDNLNWVQAINDALKQLDGKLVGSLNGVEEFKGALAVQVGANTFIMNAQGQLVEYNEKIHGTIENLNLLNGKQVNANINTTETGETTPEQYNKELDAIDNKVVHTTTSLTETGDKKISDVAQEMNRLDNKKVPLVIDTQVTMEKPKGFATGIWDIIRGRAPEAMPSSSIQVDADTSKAQEKINQLKNELVDIKTNIVVDVKHTGGLENVKKYTDELIEKIKYLNANPIVIKSIVSGNALTSTVEQMKTLATWVSAINSMPLKINLNHLTINIAQQKLRELIVQMAIINSMPINFKLGTGASTALDKIKNSMVLLRQSLTSLSNIYQTQFSIINNSTVAFSAMQQMLFIKSVNGIVSIYNQLPSKLNNITTAMWARIAISMLSGGSMVSGITSSVGARIKNSFEKHIFGFYYLGKSIPQLIARGIISSQSSVFGAIRNVANSAMSIFKSRVNSATLSRMVPSSIYKGYGAISAENKGSVLSNFQSVATNAISTIGNTYGAMSGNIPTPITSSPQATVGNLSNSIPLGNQSYISTAKAKTEELAELYKGISALDWNISYRESAITKIQSKMNLLTENTKEYRTALQELSEEYSSLMAYQKKEQTQLKNRQRLLARSLNSLKNTSKHTKAQRDTYNKYLKEYEENNEKIKQLDIERLNNTAKIREQDIKRFTDFVDEIVGKHDYYIKSISGLIDDKEFELDVLSYLEPDNIAKKLSLQKKVLDETYRLANQHRFKMNVLQNQYKDSVNLYGVDSEKTKKVLEEYEKAEEAYEDAYLNALKMDSDLAKSKKEVAEKAVSNMQDSYKKIQDITKKAYDSEIKQLEKTQKEKDKYYDDEISKIKSIYEEKEKQRQADKKEQTYNEQINELSQKRAELMNKISLSSRDTSLSGKKYTDDLKKQLDDLNKEISDVQSDRQEEMYQEQMKQQEDLQISRLESQKELQEKQTEIKIDALEAEAKRVDLELSKIISDENYWSNLIEQFTKGNADPITGAQNETSSILDMLLGGNFGIVSPSLKNMSKDNINDIMETSSSEITTLLQSQLELNDELVAIMRGQFGKDGDRTAYRPSLTYYSGQRQYDFKDYRGREGFDIKRSFTEYNSTSTSSKTAPKKVSQSSQRYHTVGKGDTLWALAWKYYNNPYKWTNIAEANNNIDPRKLRAGLRLIIPFRSGGFVNKLTLNSFNCWELLVS